MTGILQMLFLCAVSVIFPVQFPDSVCIPVQIEGGGTFAVVPENGSGTDRNETEITLADGEKGKAEFTFSEQGTWTYRMYQPVNTDSYAVTDQTVYILKITTGMKGAIESVLLYENDSNQKSAMAHWRNTRRKDSPVTGDNTMVMIYALTSLFSLLIAAVLFRCADGGDDEI